MKTTITDFSSPKYVREGTDVVDLVIDTVEHGVIPFTFVFSEEDQYEHEVQIREWLTANAGSIAAYVPDLAIIKYDSKVARDKAIESNIEVFGVEWKVDEKSRGKMKAAVRRAERLGDLTLTRNWILADNSTRETSAEELNTILDAYTDRMDTIFATYGVWMAGSMTEVFSHEQS